MAYSCSRCAPLAAPVTSGVGVCLREPATGGTTDGRGTLGLLMMLVERVDGVNVVVCAPLALRFEEEA